MTVYVIQASPLTKIFLPEWHEKCLEDPSIVVRSEPFSVRIPRPTGAIELTHNVPVIAATLVPRTMYDQGTNKTFARKIEEDVVSPLVAWLTEETNSETDIWGVVAVPIETNVADAIMTLIHEKDATKIGAKLIQDIKKKLDTNINESRARADARVMRHCDRMYRVVVATVNELKKNGKGVYNPSYTEALALDILKDQIQKRRVSTDKGQAMFDKAMETVAVSPI